MAAYPSMDWSAGSYAGPRIENEDYVVFTQSSDTVDIANKGVLMVVCDGSSSPTCGAQAARLAAHRVMELYYDSRASVNPQIALAAAVRDAQRYLQEQKQGECADMRTALCAAAVFEDIAYIAQMGEIRAYILRQGKLDHLDSALVDAENFSEKANKRDAASLLIEARYMLEPSDRVLLCSDGIYNAINDERLKSILAQNRSPEKAVDGLIKAAIDSNLSDNASAAILNLYKSRYGKTAPVNGARASSLVQTIGFLGAASLAVSVIGALIFSPNSLAAMIGNSPSPTRNSGPGIVGTRVVAVSTLVRTAEETPIPTITVAPATPIPATATLDVGPTVENTPTPTETHTPTPTATSTQTTTPTATSTQTATPTATSTQTATPTATSTQTATPTAMSTQTMTPTVTLPRIAAPTSIDTPIPSPTASATATPRPTTRPIRRPTARPSSTATSVPIVTLAPLPSPVPEVIASTATAVPNNGGQPPPEPPKPPQPTSPPPRPTDPPPPPPTEAPKPEPVVPTEAPPP